MHCSCFNYTTINTSMLFDCCVSVDSLDFLEDCQSSPAHVGIFDQFVVLGAAGTVPSTPLFGGKPTLYPASRNNKE